MPRSNFIRMNARTGDGRCRVCDLPYSRMLAKEVREHREFHRRYRDACDGGGAPVNEAERQSGSVSAPRAFGCRSTVRRCPSA
jgi:hypothetical protein